MRQRLNEHAEMKLSKRLDVELLIMHPTISPEEITAALGMEAQIAHCAGAPKILSNGKRLPGLWPDTRWRHSRQYEISDQWFLGKVEELVGRLETHKAFLTALKSSGGKATLILQFFADGYWGDNLPPALLTKLASLDLDLGIECYADVPAPAEMKNIQVIDGALNCTFSIFQATEKEFSLLFPEVGQDIQYAEDLWLLPKQKKIKAALRQLWERPIRKQNALGIDGTLFYELERYKAYYPEKREDAVIASAVNQAQRRLFGITQDVE